MIDDMDRADCGHRPTGLRAAAEIELQVESVIVPPVKSDQHLPAVGFDKGRREPMLGTLQAYHGLGTMLGRTEEISFRAHDIAAPAFSRGAHKIATIKNRRPHPCHYKKANDVERANAESD